MSIHLKSSIFKELREAEVSVVLKGIEGAAVGDATNVHVRTFRLKALYGNKGKLFNFPRGGHKKL